MKILLSELERAGVATVFLRPGSRGGSPDALLIQDDLHTLLRVDEFNGQAAVELSKLSKAETPYEIPATHVEVLRQMLGWPGQNPDGARIVARVLRKLQPATPLPPPAPPAPEEEQ